MDHESSATDPSPARPDAALQPAQAPGFTVRLPGFVSNEQVGLGTALGRVAARMGLPGCAGCQRRGATLDRWIAFTGRRPG